MNLIARRKSEQNHAVLDPWTVVHLGVGLAAGLMDFRFAPAMTAAVGYEFIEHTFEDTEAGRNLFKTSGPEIIPNAVVDVVVFGLGWWLGRKWNRT